ncbi:hypothetical protein [Lentzea atacamensis]|uniref:hypothetical protein n=1 Tax=Lentzea atacamensis TaxID=531938 RepID=UPI000D6AB3EA|nr:hypothetical protein [Lentzea atacamensis]
MPNHAGAGGQLGYVEQAASGRRICLAGNTHYRALTESGRFQALLGGLSVNRGRWPPRRGTWARIAACIKAKTDAVDDAIKVEHLGFSLDALRIRERCPPGDVLRLLEALLIRACSGKPDARAALRCGLL